MILSQIEWASKSLTSFGKHQNQAEIYPRQQKIYRDNNGHKAGRPPMKNSYPPVKIQSLQKVASETLNIIINISPRIFMFPIE